MNYKIIILIVIAIAAAVYTISYSTKTPDNIELNAGKLAPCPDSPNCVSSQENDKEHAIDTIKASGSTENVMKRLTETITQMGGKIITRKGPYLHAEFRSNVFRFVDDLECYYDKNKGLVEIRSAARLGYADFSVNRNRVEKLRKLFPL